ncbi:MAG: LapA family protein [Acidimicrobiales bacterium]
MVGVMLAFVLQNLQQAKVSFLMFSGSFPLALALAGGAVLGALVVFLLGSVRIVQLRKALRRYEANRETIREER